MIKGIKTVAERKAEKDVMAEIKSNAGKANSIAALKVEVVKLIELVESRLK